MAFDWSALASGVATLGGNLIGSLMSKHSNKESQKRQHRYELENLAIANQYAIDAFNRENEYNTPLAQRQRMQQAGLNPNWVDGGINVVAQQESPMSASTSASAQNVSMNGLMNGVFDMYLANKQLAEQKRVNDSIIDLNNAEAQRKRGLLPSEVKNLDSGTKRNIAEADEKAAEAGIKSKELDSFQEKLDAFLRSQNSQSRLNEVLADVNEQRLPKELEKLVSEIAKNDADKAKVLNDIAISRILANNDVRRVQIEQQNAITNSRNADINQQNANTNSYNAITNRINANETIRNNHEVNSMTKAFNSVLSEESQSRRAKLDKEAYYQQLQNDLTEQLNKSGLPMAIQNATLWKLIADKDYIITQKEKLGQEIEFFEDTYFGRLIKEHLPIPFLK